MDGIIGFVLGLAVLPLLRWLKPKKEEVKPPLTDEQKRLIHEYRNFVNYTGDEQEEYTP